MVYFAASCDSPETNKRFAESLGLDYPILSDPGCKVARAYGVASATRKFPQRWTFIIGPDGKIVISSANGSADVETRDCVRQAIRQINFPTFSGGIVVVDTKLQIRKDQL